MKRFVLPYAWFFLGLASTIWLFGHLLFLDARLLLGAPASSIFFFVVGALAGDSLVIVVLGVLAAIFIVLALRHPWGWRVAMIGLAIGLVLTTVVVLPSLYLYYLHRPFA